jgi:Flp pilus assembly protein TadG
MNKQAKTLWQQARARVRRQAARFGHDDNGATAVEFGLVAVPFLMLLFGIIAVGMFFFTTFSLENAVETAARPIRTGEAQVAGLTKDQFKANVCSLLPVYVDCGSALRVNVQSFAVNAIISPPACVDAGGALVAPADTKYITGTANEIVLVTACLQYSFAGQIPFLQLGTMADGSALIQASITFKTEPYTN